MTTLLVGLLGIAIVSVYGLGIGATKAIIDNADGEHDENVGWAVVWPATAILFLLFTVLVCPGVWLHDKIRGKS